MNVTDGSFGFDTDNEEENGMNFLFEQLLSYTQSNVQNAAIWPNVRTVVSTHSTNSQYPQSFKGINPVTFEDSSSNWLELLDGGSNLEKSPLSSLLVKARGLDVVVVVDGSADDSNNWPK